MSVDVTGSVEFRDNDGESLPLTQCVCGQKYDPWERILSIYPGTIHPCAACGARLFFRADISVFQVLDDV